MTASSEHFDVIIIGAGAAGMMAAAVAGQRGKRVLLLDHAQKIGEKIRISGGGRCNFTNIHASPAHYLSDNPRFCVSALSRYTPADFIALVEKHGIAYHEKTLGQLFCDGSATQIIDMLLKECADAGVNVRAGTAFSCLEKDGADYRVTAENGTIFRARALIIATGGPSIPKIGATGIGYRIAEQFGLSVIPPRAGLVPFTVNDPLLSQMKPLAGMSLPASVSCNGAVFDEGMLFTHRGLSGPAVLQISSYWTQGDDVFMDIIPHVSDKAEWLESARRTNGKQQLITILQREIPKRLAQHICETGGFQKRLADYNKTELTAMIEHLEAWRITPGGTEGYRTAEVALGGVNTKELNSQTMEAKKAPGLYFIGEVVDVTGHLGGFNFQWAWASGVAAGQAV